MTLAAMLGTAPTVVQNEFEHLGSCELTDLATAQVPILLKGLGGNQAALRSACRQVGIHRTQHHQEVKPADLRKQLKIKLLDLLPPLPFRTLLEQNASPAVAQDFTESGGIPVTARDAEKVKELLRALCPNQLTLLRKVATQWQIAQRDSDGQRLPVESLRSHLRGACIRFLKESEPTPSSSNLPAAVSSSSGSVVLSDNGPASLEEAHKWLETNQVVALKRVTGKRQAMSAVPAELVKMVKDFCEDKVSKQEQKYYLTVAGCKLRRKVDGKIVHIDSVLSSCEARRGTLETFRMHLGLDRECWCHDVDFKTPRTLEAFAASLKHAEYVKMTPFAKDFRTVQISKYWDAQHVFRRMAAMELGNASVLARRKPLPLLDGPVVSEVMTMRGQLREKQSVQGLEEVVDALEKARCCMPDQPAWFKTAWGVDNREHLEKLVFDFDLFLIVNDLRDLWHTASLGTAMVWVGWWSMLTRLEKEKVSLQEKATERRGLLKSPSPSYIPAAAMDESYVCPVHFKQEAAGMTGVGAGNPLHEQMLPKLIGPRVCELCGDGFVTWTALAKHVEAVHVSWAEYRKRVFWHAQCEDANVCHAVPLSWSRKRQILGNATTHLVSAVSSKPVMCKEHESKESAPPEREKRELVGCAVCATQEWTERMRRCYMFRGLPLGQEASVETTEVEDEQKGAEELSEEEKEEDEAHLRRGLLKDKGGLYYFGPPEVINEFLKVEKYAERWPQIPVEELHASSVQHPEHSGFRWLLHTRRVPVKEVTSTGNLDDNASAIARASTETLPEADARPPCAGIGDPDATVLLCRWCAKNVCHRKPTLPQRALANDLWGGREHPLFQKLRNLPAAKMLLGQARVLFRKVVLNQKHGREAVELQHGLQGNTTFIAQPKTSAIVKTLPPAMEDVAEQLQVVFSVSRTDVAKAKPLQIPRGLYLACARRRQAVCPLFADVTIDETRVATELRDEEAPPALVAGAVRMEDVNKFRPNLTGPASTRVADAAAASREEEILEVGMSDEEPASLEVDGESTPAAARGDAGGTVEEEEAENLIGLDDAAENDPLQPYVVVQEQIRRLQEDQARVQRKEERLEAVEGDARVVAGMQLTAAREACRGHALELREVCRRLADRHETEIEKELQLLEKPEDSGGNVLVVQAGQLLSMFVPEAWCLAFTEFFFGDCLPFDQRRPVRMAPGSLMEALLKREELSYQLTTDAMPYVALSTSRWDNPEIVAMFADTLRRKKLLLATKMTFLSQESFKLDLKAIAQAKAEDFQELQRYSTLGQAYASAKNQDKPAMKALKHLLTSTAVVPLTDGNKMKLRHFGHAMDMTFGPLKMFLTCNFADTYMPLTIIIYDSRNMEQLTDLRCNLLDNRPDMPPLQAMHRVVAQSPATQARLFLLMEEIVLTQILGVETAYLGNHVFDDPEMPLRLRMAKEDHLASNGSLGVAEFVESVLMPLEAQGRGFAHGHKKVISLPNYSASRLKTLFAKDSAALIRALDHMRKQVVDAVSLVQYDTATLPGEQLGVDLPPEPFSRQQQRQSRLDGGISVKNMFIKDKTKCLYSRTHIVLHILFFGVFLHKNSFVFNVSLPVVLCLKM